jgi:serine/threonine protein kinase
MVVLFYNLYSVMSAALFTMFSYVHSEGYMHRDLTSMNILLQNQPGTQYVKAIVADFGLSVRIPEFPIKLEQVGSQSALFSLSHCNPLSTK